MKKILINLSIFVFYFLISCANVNTVKIPENFSERNIPKSFSKDWYELNYSNDDYLVKNIKNNLVIEKTKYRNNSELIISNGKLFGSNGGEWGGELFFIPNNKELKKIKIKDGNIVDIFKFQNKIYFIEGLAHLSISEGALYELEINNNTFNFEKLIDFEDAPAAITTYKNKIYVASHQNFYEVENFQKKKIFGNEFWTSLYPNSIAIFNEENVFIGMRSGFARINLKNKKINFYRETNNP